MSSPPPPQKSANDYHNRTITVFPLSLFLNISLVCNFSDQIFFTQRYFFESSFRKPYYERKTLIDAPTNFFEVPKISEKTQAMFSIHLICRFDQNTKRR